MPRPKSLVPTKRLEVKVPLLIYEAMLKNQAEMEGFGVATTLNSIIVYALREMLFGASGSER